MIAVVFWAYILTIKLMLVRTVCSRKALIVNITVSIYFDIPIILKVLC